jgi:hypothetical protein
VLKRFSIITKLNSITLVATLVLLYALAPVWQIKGALLAVLVGEAILAVSLWYVFSLAVFHENKSTLMLNFAANWNEKHPH